MNASPTMQGEVKLAVGGAISGQPLSRLVFAVQVGQARFGSRKNCLRFWGRKTKSG